MNNQNNNKVSINQVKIALKNLYNYTKILNTFNLKLNIKLSLSKQMKIKRITNVFQTKELSIEMKIEDYIDRIYSTKIFSPYTILCAGILLRKIILSKKHQIDFNSATFIKCFAACLKLVHKYFSDVQYGIKSYSKILGFFKESLKEMEKILFRDILEFDLHLAEKDINGFLSWTENLKLIK